jgi:predicted unusual protein kinase regulating ubiquinone biosynthesis (AarF/ABC1/UbiB family)
MPDSSPNPVPAALPAAAPRVDRRRYLRVVRFFAAAFITVIWWDLILRRVPGLRTYARRSALTRWRGIARRFRRLAVQMGGVLIKLGQFLSIRVDVLPVEITSELAGLQDEVPAETPADVLAVISAEFGRPAAEVFARFDPRPSAAASLAQVHHAQLAGGGEVVVKVQRPRIGEIVETDLAAIRQAATWLKFYPPIARRVDLDRLFYEFAAVTRRELDFVAEGKNAERFAADFAVGDAAAGIAPGPAADPAICIARVYWDYTTRRVLTLENVASLKITDYAAIEAAGISRAAVARKLYDTYLKQIFITNFVHADPHPGNLFINPLPYADDMPQEAAGRPFQLIFIDFGMVATIPEKLRGSLREYIIGIGSRDAHRVVQAYVAAGVLLPGADLPRLEALHDDMFTRLAGVRMGQLANVAMEQAEFMFLEYRDILREMPFQFPTDIMFVGRAVGILSGIATGLDPDFDPWAATIPFAERLARQEAGGALAGGLAEIGSVARVALTLPTRVDHFLQQAERGELVMQTRLAPDAARLARRLERAIDRLTWAVIFAALLGGGIALRASTHPDALSATLLVAAGVALLWGLTRR